jgi:hypothetical protein
MKKLFWVTLIIAFNTFVAAVSGQGLQNGTFDTSLDHWTAEPANSDAVLYYQGAAVLSNPGDYPLDSSWIFSEDSFKFLESYTQLPGTDVDFSQLVQSFTVPVNAQQISFKVKVEVYDRLSISETDTLTVKAWYGSGLTSNLEIYTVNSDDVDYFHIPGNYIIDDVNFNEDTEIFTHHVIYETTVSYDISSLAGQDVSLEFILSHDNDDEIRTAVTIDDVVISTGGDSTPPVVTVCDMTELWPPNHKYHIFNLSDIIKSIVDGTDGNIDINSKCRILSIYSDEPEDVKGNGDGNTEDDIVILSKSSFEVRAEREGNGNGRVYGVTFEVSDSSGNVTVKTAYLGVPHDQGKGTIINDGKEAGYIVEAE